MELPPPPPPAAPAQGRMLPGPLAGSLAGPLPSPAPGELPVPGGSPDAATRAGVLSGAWRWTLGLGWCVVLAGLGALAQSAFLVDADPWWLRFKPIPFALPVAVLLALVGESRWTLALSGAAAAVLVALALIDAAKGSSVVAIAEGLCAASAVLLTVAATLGRARAPRSGVPGSAA